MILNDHNLLHYLLARGLVSPSAAVDGDVQVVAGERRHRHFRVERQHGPGLFVKQVKQWDPETTGCLRREAACYRLAAEDEGFAVLRDWVPAFRDYDPVRHTLSVEYFHGAENLTHFHGQGGAASTEVAGDLGEMLGAWHRRIRVEPGDPRFAGLFPGRLPWILALHRTPMQTYHPQGQGALFVANTLRQDPALRQAMEELARSYRLTCLIHGDVKWDNVLVVEEGDGTSVDGGDQELAVKMIDWELADLGDPRWDVGGALQSYLSFWLLSMPLTSGASPQQIEQQANFPLSGVQPAFRAFWDSYREARGLDDDEAPAELRACLRFAAGRLTQSAYEAGVAYGQAIPQIRFMLQLSQNMLLKTDSAVHDLLGM